MSGQREFAGAIWTNHALERLGQRGLTQSLAARALTEPDEIIPGKKPGTHEHIKKVSTSKITLITTESDEGKTLVLSNWIDPPLPGTQDAKKKQEWKKYKKAGFWGKLWYQLRQQLFSQK